MTQFLKKYWSHIALVIACILLFSQFQCAGPEKESTTTTTTVKDVKVQIPSSTGSFEVPAKKTELPSSGTDSIKTKNHTYYSTHPFDKEKAAEYLKTKDSLKQAQLFIKAIQEKENITDFENDKLKLKVYTKVAGELKEVNVKEWEIKPQEVTVQETTKETVITKTVTEKDKFGLVAGGGAGKNLETQKINFEANAGIRVGKLTFLAGANTDKTVTGKVLIEF